MNMSYLLVKSVAAGRIQQGYPWVYTPGLAIKKPLDVDPGRLVTLLDESRAPLGVGFYNPLSKLACRILSLDAKEPIDTAFFHARFTRALERRQRFFDVPYYRLVHAESDNLPGLIVDRFGDTFVCQTNTAGMEHLKPLWLEALVEIFNPNRVIFKDTAPLRAREGLTLGTSAPIGNLQGTIDVIENGLHYYGNPMGQKTGWFYDHRANRFWVASRAKKQRVLDLYTYHGGFGLLAAAKGAHHVTLIDSSEAALQISQQTAATHQLNNCHFIQDTVFEALEKLIENQSEFDIVIADPPAFVKQANHQGAGLRGYEKLARLASQVIAPNGMLFIASCSHHASSNEFRNAVETGLQKNNRSFSLLRKAGADKDHPIHPQLPETHYLKSLAYRLDL